MEEQPVNIREGKQVRVIQKITEGKRERSVPFTGKVLKVRGIGVNKTITVRQTLEGVEVDRIFPISSPTISKIEILEEKKTRKVVKKTKRAPKKVRKSK